MSAQASAPSVSPATRPAASRALTRDAGASAVALLAVLLVLGGIAGAVLALQPNHNSGRGAGRTQPTVNASPSHASGDISQASQEACQANYQTLQTAVSEYEAVNGRPPASMNALTSMIHSPVSTYFYAITIDPDHPGQIDVATRGHPASPGEAGCRYAGSR